MLLALLKLLLHRLLLMQNLTLLVFIIRVIIIAMRSERGLGSYLCVGLAGCLIIQIIINVGMCFGMLPVIGITLPFLSCGGSSMLSLFMMMGLLHNVYSHSSAVREYEKEDTFDIDSSLLGL